MRSSSSFATLLPLAGVLSTVTAAGTLGFALGDKKADGTCKFTEDYEADFDTILKGSTARIVRGYAASDCDTAKEILPAAKTKGFQVVLGIWYVSFLYGGWGWVGGRMKMKMR